jgi:hypothetical protein
MDSSEKPFTIHSACKITLGPLAKEMAQQNGMSLTEMARHLLDQHALQQAGLIQKQGEN